MKSQRANKIWGALMFVCLCLVPSVLSSQPQSDDRLSITSNTPYGNCPAPTTAGVRICQPIAFSGVAGIASPFQLIASGTGSGGPVRNMQVWIDGVKVKEANGNLFDAPIRLSDGTHRLVVVELDTTGAYRKSSPISLEIQGSTSSEPCSPPSTPGVNLCEPFPGSSCHTTGWTTIIASGTGASGTVRRMELWNSGVKIANFPGNSINTNLYLSDFTTVTIVEVDSAGAYIKSRRVLLESC